MPEPSQPAAQGGGPSWLARQLSVRTPVRAAAAWLLWALLAGYLIFNKPFAKLGCEPLYVGEMVLACVVLSLLANLRSVFCEPIRRSWAFHLIAVFWCYGLLRALAGLTDHGYWALRDSVTATYAFVAFAAPAAWCVLARRRSGQAGGSAPRPAPQEEELQDLPSHIATCLLPVATLAALWAAAFANGWIEQRNWLDTKADFLTLAAAVAAWLWALAAVKVQPWRRGGALGNGTRVIAVLGAAVLAVEGFCLTKSLPTRTMWLVAGPLAALTVAAWAYTRARRRMLLAAGLGLACAAALVLRGFPAAFSQFEHDYALAEELDFSSDDREIHLRRYPDRFERLVLSNVTTGDARAERERWRSLLAPDETQFQTAQGRLGAHAIKWRAVFWLRCWDYTLRQAPLLGIGFGANLTNLLRHTPAWPMYIDSMRVDPPNRSPHCAHVTILTRLGLIGLALWLAILALVLWGALQVCWHHRAGASSRTVSPDKAALHRTRFWDGLAILGVWLIYLWAMTFGVVLEGPLGGIWFWALTGVLAWWRLATPDVEVAGKW